MYQSEKHLIEDRFGDFITIKPQQSCNFTSIYLSMYRLRIIEVSLKM